MSTGTDLIEKALMEIGAHSVVSPAPPESINIGLGKLNAMLQQWTSESIAMEVVPLRAAGEQLGEPADATDAIIYNLAIRLAPSFDAPVSPDLRGLAQSTYSTIKALYRKVTIPRLVPTGTLPKGSGHSKGYANRTYMKPGEAFDA